MVVVPQMAGAVPMQLSAPINTIVLLGMEIHPSRVQTQDNTYIGCL